MTTPRDTDQLLREAFRVARMNSFEWDAASDRLVRFGEIDAVFNVAPEILGTTGAAYLELIHPADRAKYREARAQVQRTNREFHIEYRILVPNGVVRWLEDTAYGEFDESGALVRLEGMTLDITPRREAEERLTLLASISDLIGSFDDAGELLYAVSCAVGEQLHVRRCLFTEIDLDNDRGVVRRDYCRGTHSVAGVYKVSDYSETTRRVMMAGETVVNFDSKHDPRTAGDYARTYGPQGERSYIAVPLLRDGRWVAELWISDDVPRRWSDQDITLLESVAERVWTAVEKLRVHAALKESEARVQFVGERAEVGYWYWDLPQNLLVWSPVCKRLFGIPADETVTYRLFIEAVHPEDRGLVELAVRSALEGDGEYDLECRTLRRDGTVRWIRTKGSATFEDETPVRMAGIALDVTQRRVLDQQREELLALERRLRAEADEASLAKDHFLALLSHELRTPMTTILGWASFLGSGMAEPGSMQSGIESIEQASRAQARLIEDLLDVSRIITGKLMLEDTLFDVTTAVRAAIEVIQPGAREKALDVVVDFAGGPAFVRGDAARIQQVIWNLLSNSVKFTPPGGRIEVSVTHAASEVEISVRDNGSGMEPDFVPHVFERFRQAEDGPSRRFGGLGLGLSIVRHLTEMHDGTVEAKSDGPGRGAEFIVRLPSATASHDTVPASRPQPQMQRDALRGVRVLLVDDDASARTVIGTMLSGFGASVAQAASAHEALQSLAVERPDVIVSDIGMPEEDGYEFMRIVRSSGELYATVPAIAVTAYADPRDRERAITGGYQAHLAKPVEAVALASAVLQALPQLPATIPPTSR